MRSAPSQSTGTRSALRGFRVGTGGLRRCVQKLDLIENIDEESRSGAGVISDHASDLGPIFICCGIDRRMDESASTKCHPLSDGGESRSSLTDREQTTPIH